MKALVIGASGFVGLNVVDALLAHGHTVRATQRRKTITLLLRNRGVELAPATLEDPIALRDAMIGCDTVFLTGAYYPRDSRDLATSVRTGVAQMRNVCVAAREASIATLIYTSSTGALGAARNGVCADEDDIPDSMPQDSVYRAVKWAMERELEAHAPRTTRLVTMIPGGCIGPWDLRAGTAAVMLGVIRGELPWWVDGLVNIVDVGDVALAHVIAAERAFDGRICVAGHDLSMARLLRHTARRFGGGLPVRRLDPAEARMRADADEQAAARNGGRAPIPRELVDLVTSGQRVSSARARELLGTRFRPLDETLDRAHAWFVRFRYLPTLSTKEVV